MSKHKHQSVHWFLGRCVFVRPFTSLSRGVALGRRPAPRNGGFWVGFLVLGLLVLGREPASGQGLGLCGLGTPSWAVRALSGPTWRASLPQVDSPCCSAPCQAHPGETQEMSKTRKSPMLPPFIGLAAAFGSSDILKRINTPSICILQFFVAEMHSCFE